MLLIFKMGMSIYAVKKLQGHDSFLCSILSHVSHYSFGNMTSQG